MHHHKVRRFPEVLWVMMAGWVLGFCWGAIACAQAHTDQGDLARKLRDSGWFGRSNAADRMGYTRDPRDVEPLIAALKDKSSVVRESAASALGRIRDPRA
ncbi:MAG: HEAT repeat domain-containing protein, partial [Candidatus Sumerlaeota bacterium]|nr:HEAT repeat domain-containing protein [Candidatus Sumerlaeota bacterium]